MTLQPGVISQSTQENPGTEPYVVLRELQGFAEFTRRFSSKLSRHGNRAWGESSMENYFAVFLRKSSKYSSISLPGCHTALATQTKPDAIEVGHVNSTVFAGHKNSEAFKILSNTVPAFNMLRGQVI